MSRHSRPNTPLRIALAVISVLLIVVLMAVTLIYRPSWLHADTPTVERSSVGRTVSPRQRQTYCPSRMTIADTDAYGDSEYQASNGNIASSARYAAFGSVFHSSVASMGADMTASVSMLDCRWWRPISLGRMMHVACLPCVPIAPNRSATV